MHAPFSADEAYRAADTWGFNCGPAALAAALALPIDQVRPHLGQFEQKRYMNPTMMEAALDAMGVQWACVDGPRLWHGIVRVRWDGPWMQPGVPIQARYRHTHWIAADRTTDRCWIFDINCISCGGWVEKDEWQCQVVPWLLRNLHPKASGFHATHFL